jgi:hypothetical protein
VRVLDQRQKRISYLFTWGFTGLQIRSEFGSFDRTNHARRREIFSSFLRIEKADGDKDYEDEKL